MNRPYVILSCAMSIDGYLDSAAPAQARDVERGRLRPGRPAARRQRRDHGRRLDRPPRRPAAAGPQRRAAAGAPRRGQAELADEGDGHRERRSAAAVGVLHRGRRREARVLPAGERAHASRSRLGDVATVVGARAARDDGGRRSPTSRARGVRRLMVEGGGRLHTQFLVDDLVDELQLVVAPFFVGESRAPRFVEAGRFPWTSSRRATLADTRRIGDVVLLRYALSDRFAGRSRGSPRRPGDSSARS